MTTSTFPTSAWELIGVLLCGYTAILGFAATLIRSQRADNKALQDKLMDRAIPALEANAAATVKMIEATQQALQTLAADQALKERRR